ncbi:NAD(+) diphosphatase [Microbacterium esteraromaticum]|uniref:NAD(+) diphosphatase n=1 Tax=Microbacterium esteraromaticum TaxID=57043 RepID=UPI001A8EBD78|nr:NAD(+) diphosphatase [Microbacterium esteraromaticum]MBN8423836.1 NAD(+) diphosphatase [Microbacterium esteraromaticum]
MIASEALLDRAADLRTEPGVIERLIAEPGTRVIVVRQARLRIADGTLLRVDANTVGDAEWALLGREADGTALLLASVPPRTDSIDAAPDETWLGLRDVGGDLTPYDADVFVTAIALAAWLADARHCPSCGTRLTLTQAGWARWCDRCRREHFPRTDPAVIVAIESPDGERLLLGANVNWRGRMYSCFAGFVEAGESLESAVHREIEEEAGVRLSELRYIGSQPWPYPRSLMIGFRAVAADESAVADGDEIVDVRWLTRDEIGSALAGEGPVGLPGEASIARRLISDWYARPRPTGGTMAGGVQ